MSHMAIICLHVHAMHFNMGTPCGCDIDMVFQCSVLFASCLCCLHEIPIVAVARKCELRE